MTHTIPHALHHPNEDLLGDYVRGQTSEGMNLLISSHLSFCPKCQRLAHGLEGLASTIIASAYPEPVSKNIWDSCLAKIQNLGSAASNPPTTEHIAAKTPTIACNDPAIPYNLRKLLPAEIDQLPWKYFVGKTIKEYKIGKDDGWRWGLVYTKAGGKLPYHSHRGIEATLILKGRFSDNTGSYKAGDFVMCDQTITHQPMMGVEDDCLCLYALNAPIQFKGSFLRLANPFLRI